VQLLDADLGGRVRLLAAADAGDVGSGHLRVEPAGVAVGDHAVGDVRAGVGPPCHGAGGAEIDVVGVGGDDQAPARP
jgi:hypothetical protein